jgi:hypothetical protein
VNPDLSRFQRMALGVAVIGIIATVAGALINSGQFYRSYLVAYLFWLSFALGSLGIVLLHNVVGGRWGVLIRQFLESGVRTLPLMALLVVPILIGIPVLYHWSHAEAVASDHVLQEKQAYLNVPAFVGRTVVYFLIWIGMSLLLKRRRREGAKAISAPGLIIFVFSVTFAAVDWVMSLEPHWYSTIYGAILLVGQVLQTIAFCIALVYLLSDREPLSRVIEPPLYHDLGNLMLAFTVLWAYTSFSQFLIIWWGNIPEETPWYLRRSHGGWQFVSVALVLFHFAVPFFILLSRYVKRRGRLLARVAMFIVAVRFLDLLYWVEPSHHEYAGVHWLHLATVLAIGGVWVWFFLWNLARGPLVDAADPRLLPKEVHH